MGEIKKRKKTGAVVLSVLFLCMLWTTASFAVEQGGQPLAQSAETGTELLAESGLYAQSAVLMDGRTGRILWGKQEDVIRPMASTTKIMTCILALEAGLDAPERTTEVSAYAASQPQVHLGMKKGQRFFTKDLLHSLMLESHNDSAAAIAEAAAGSVEAFARQMNEKAEAIGCEHTWFITPNGLDGKEKDAEGKERIHSTTAEDLARILRYCVLKSPKAAEFLTITQTMDYCFRDADGKGSYNCHNHNALFSMMDGVMSGKTGFTGGAGYCYTGAVEDEGRIFIIALLGCGWPPHKTYKWSDARALISYGREHYQYRNLYRDVSLSAVPVKNGVSGSGDYRSCTVRLTVQKKELPVLASREDRVQIVKNIPEFLEAPVEAGSRVGTIDYYLNQEQMASCPVLAAESIVRFTWSWCLEQISEAFFLRAKS
ncbi:MAG: D-alanyl-D-alanine carboxypeptidase [Lachnospiraceae bacterium]|nr:D-alanyl-D-alanine carboxypeptidase [Lachnospiraceae bacterium]